MGALRWDRAKRRDATRDGGADDDRRGGGAAWGSKPPTKTQLREMEEASVELGIAIKSSDKLTRNTARKWLSRAKVERTMRAARGES